MWTPRLALYRRALQKFPNVGVCLQAYLHRTREDLASLLPLRRLHSAGKRRVQRAAEIAFPEKSRVDENYFLLAKEMLLAKNASRNPRGVWNARRGTVAAHFRFCSSHRASKDQRGSADALRDQER